MTNVTRAILAIHSVEYLDEVKRRRHLIDIRCCQPIRCPFFFTGDACSARSIVLIRVPCFPTVYCSNCNALQFGVIYHSLTHHRQYLNNIINYPIEYKNPYYIIDHDTCCIINNIYNSPSTDNHGRPPFISRRRLMSKLY